MTDEVQLVYSQSGDEMVELLDKHRDFPIGRRTGRPPNRHLLVDDHWTIRARQADQVLQIIRRRARTAMQDDYGRTASNGSGDSAPSAPLGSNQNSLFDRDCHGSGCQCCDTTAPYVPCRVRLPFPVSARIACFA